MDRSKLLTDKVKTDREVYPFVLDLNPLFPDVGSITRIYLTFT